MYGLNKEDINLAKQKINKAKHYILHNGVSYIDDKNEKVFIPFSDFTKNAWHNADKYIAELQNRANSLSTYAKNHGLINIFLTLTLPSHYHPTKTLKNGKIIENPKYIDHEDFTPKAGAKKLSAMWKRVLDLRALKDIGKDNKCYFRVTEPHKNGTPHLHISLYIPKDNIERFLDAISRIYKIPQIDISSEYIPSSYSKFYDKTVKKVIYKKDLNDNFGITTLIKNPSAYLMKYILKTFDDLREDNSKFTDLTLWYIHHGICRFYTSRTLIPLNIYRKINYISKFQDMYKATEFYKKGGFCLSWKLIESINYKTGEVMQTKIMSGIEMVTGKWDKDFNEPVFKQIWRKKEYINFKNDPTEIVPICIDDKNLVLKNGLFLEADEEFDDMLDEEELI